MTEKEVLSTITDFPEFSDEMINKDGEVVIDEFYQNMIHQIDPHDEGEKYSKEELLKELGIV